MMDGIQAGGSSSATNHEKEVYNASGKEAYNTAEKQAAYDRVEKEAFNHDQKEAFASIEKDRDLVNTSGHVQEIDRTFSVVSICFMSVLTDNVGIQIHLNCTARDS